MEKLFFSGCLVCISMTRALRCQYALENKGGLPTSGAGVDIPCRRSTDFWRRREVCTKSVDRLLASKVLRIHTKLLV